MLELGFRADRDERRRDGQLLAARRRWRSACCPTGAASCAAGSASSPSARRSPSAPSRSTGPQTVSASPPTGRRSAPRSPSRTPSPSALRTPESIVRRWPGISASAAASSSRRRYLQPQRLARLRPRSRSGAGPADARRPRGDSNYWEFETTGRFLASEYRDLTVSYVRSHSTRDLNDYDQFFGNFRNPIIRRNENSLSPTDVPNRADRPRLARAAGSVGVHADLRMADRVPVVGGRRIPGLRRPAEPRRDGCPRSRPSTSRWRGRGGSRSTASPPASRSTTPSTPAASATCRPTSRRPTTAAFYNPIQRSIGFLVSTSR